MICYDSNMDKLFQEQNGSGLLKQTILNIRFYDFRSSYSTNTSSF